MDVKPENRKVKKTVLIVLASVFIVVLLCVAAFRVFSPRETVHISGLLAEVTTDELFSQASLIVKGQVAGHSDAFQIQSPSGAVENFTDYYVTVQDVLRGNTDSDTVTVRVEGGTVGNYTEIYEQSPNFRNKGEYLLFLYRPGRGGAFNTQGDYYYVLGLTQGIFEENAQGVLISQTGTELPETMMVSTADDEPVNENYFREQYILNQQSNLESGFITQEEYDQLMSDIDRYAVILE